MDTSVFLNIVFVYLYSKQIYMEFNHNNGKTISKYLTLVTKYDNTSFIGLISILINIIICFSIDQVYSLMAMVHNKLCTAEITNKTINVSGTTINISDATKNIITHYNKYNDKFLSYQNQIPQYVFKKISSTMLTNLSSSLFSNIDSKNIMVQQSQQSQQSQHNLASKEAINSFLDNLLQSNDTNEVTVTNEVLDTNEVPDTNKMKKDN